jgi:hypothetical protein
VGVEDQQGAEDRVHDGVQGAGSEGSDSQRDQSDRDESRSASASIVLIYTLHWVFIDQVPQAYAPLKCPVVATLRRVRLGNRSRVVHWESLMSVHRSSVSSMKAACIGCCGLRIWLNNGLYSAPRLKQC